MYHIATFYYLILAISGYIIFIATYGNHLIERSNFYVGSNWFYEGDGDDEEHR